MCGAAAQCTRVRGPGDLLPSPPRAAGGFPGTPGWARRKAWEARKVGRGGKEGGGTRGANAIYPPPRGCSGPGSPRLPALRRRGAEPGASPLAAACRMWSAAPRAEQQPVHGMQRAAPAWIRPRSIPPLRMPPSPAHPLSPSPQVPGRWRASRSSFGWAPRWPQPSSSPNTTRIRGGHRVRPLRSCSPAPQSHLRPDREETPGPTEDAPTFSQPSSTSKTWGGGGFSFPPRVTSRAVSQLALGVPGRTASPFSSPLTPFLA